jgi:putative ABC transport system permease protein
VNCANIANLLLARAAASSREFSVRIAIGASRWRLVRQLMTESLLLSLLGAAGGLLIAQWGGKALVHFISTAGRPIEIDTSPDVRVLAFTAGIAMITALLFGLAPAMRASGTGAQSLRRGDGNVLAGPARLGFGKALVAAQVAFSLVLLMGTGLFLGTLRNLLSVDIGFDRQQVLLATVDSEQMAASGQRRAQLYRELRSRVQTMPGVVSVSESFLAPLGAAGWAQPVYPEGFAVKSPMDSLVFLNRVSPGYFHTMKTAVMMGREFNERDTLKAPRVMIINETTARRFFGSANPVGKTIGMDKGVPGGGRELYQVIGIVRDARYNRIDEGPRSVAYVASTQVDDPSPTVTLEIRTDRAPEAMIAPVRQAMIAVDRNVSLQFRSLETQVNESVMGPRVVALLSAIFGVLALVLAMVGLYGVTSYRVKQRSNEIGVRMALGAGQGSVVWLLLREVLLVLTLGISAGIAIAVAMAQLVTALLYGMKPSEPVQIVATVMLLVMASLIAAYFPVRRATRLDPMTTLRAE